MGDKLRATLGVASEWTEREKRYYGVYCKSELGSAYMVEGLSKENPADRARYLDRKLELSPKTEEHILKMAEQHGKGHALLHLESIAITQFF